MTRHSPRKSTDEGLELIEIGQLEAQRNAPSLLDLVKNRNSSLTVTKAAVRALGNLHAGEAWSVARTLLEHDDVTARVTGAVALGRIGGDEAIAALRHALRDVTPDVRWSAADALGTLRAAVATEDLIEALTDKHRWVRRSAAEALASIGDRRALAALQNARRSEPLLRRRHISRAIRRLAASQQL